MIDTKIVKVVLKQNLFASICVVISLQGQVQPSPSQASQYSIANKSVLAKVGDKVITVREFRARSEFTVRPNNFKNKNITLNNLILEKVLALEAEHDTGATLRPAFQSMLDGIKEQQMRAQLYYEVAYNKAKLSPEEVRSAYALSMREYELEFYRLPNKKFADRVQDVIKNTPELSDTLFKEIEETLGKVPIHKAKFDDDDDNAIHTALYTRPLQQGEVLGPIRLGDGGYIVMKVLSWTTYPVIGEGDQKVRWDKVSDIIRNRKAEKQWYAYQASVMKGKQLKFEKHALDVLSTWAMDNYFLGKQNDSLDINIAPVEEKKPEIDFGITFFTLEKKAWTINDFRSILRTHPLVYRTKALDSSNFREQFKLAIIDLVRDHFITRAAYKKKLDSHEEVRNVVARWKDSFLSDGMQKKIVDDGVKNGIVNKDDQRNLSQFWDSRMLDLQKKYGHKIWIDYDLLNKVSLTQIDMITLKPGFPYPLEVPRFPLLMVSENLNYATLKQ